METKDSLYPFSIQVGNKNIKVRKWKAKDRKAFKKEVQENNGTNIDKIISETLVYSCMEDKNIALTNEEVQYVFTKLRKISISDTFKFVFNCNHCEKNNEIVLKIDDVSKPVFSDFSTIQVDDITLELQDIKNKKFYDENKDEFDDSKELAFHIKSINSDMTKSFDDLVNMFDEMDLDKFDRIFEEFQKMNFHIDTTCDCKCMHCGKITTYEFDEIPNFFPDSWTS